MDITWTDAILSLGIGVGLAAAAGFRVFIPLLMLGIAARTHFLNLNDGFAWLGSVPAIGAFSIATLVEIAAYYIPAIDNFLDFLTGPLAVVSGVLATAAVITDMPPLLRWFLVIVAGGGTAGVVQGLTTIVRLKSTVFTAGLGNFVIATLEWIGSLIASIIAILAPLIAMAAIGIFLVVVLVAGNRLKTSGANHFR